MSDNEIVRITELEEKLRIIDEAVTYNPLESRFSRGDIMSILYMTIRVGADEAINTFFKDEALEEGVNDDRNCRQIY